MAAALALGGYLVNSVLSLVEPLAPANFATPWYWYLQRNMLAEGVPIAAIIAPVLISGLLFGAGWAAFSRRDLR